MCGLDGSEDLLALIGLVDRVFLRDGDGTHDLTTIGILQRHRLTFRQTVRLILRGGKRDRNRPKHTIAGHTVIADAPPVIPSCESGKWREGSDAEHDEIGGFARVHVDLR